MTIEILNQTGTETETETAEIIEKAAAAVLSGAAVDFQKFIGFQIAKGTGTGTGNQADDECIVEGFISSEVEDSDNEIITFEAMDRAIEKYMEWGNLRAMHQPIAAGTVQVIKAVSDEYGRRHWIQAKVVDRDSKEKVRAGVYKGFSVGGKSLPGGVEVKKRDDGSKVVVFNSIDMYEISIVDRPANPHAKITFWKGDNIQVSKNKAAAVDTNPAPETNIDIAKNVGPGTETETELIEATAPVQTETGTGTGTEIAKSVEVLNQEPVVKNQENGLDKLNRVLAISKAKTPMAPDKLTVEMQNVRNGYEMSGNYDSANMLTNAIQLVVLATLDDWEDKNGGDGDDDDKTMQGGKSADVDPDNNGDTPPADFAAAAGLKHSKRDLQLTKVLSSLSLMLPEDLKNKFFEVEKSEKTTPTEPVETAIEKSVGTNTGSGSGSEPVETETAPVQIEKSVAVPVPTIVDQAPNLDYIKIGKAIADSLNPAFNGIAEILENFQDRIEKFESLPRSGGPALGRGVQKSVPVNISQDQDDNQAKINKRRSEIENELPEARRLAIVEFNKVRKDSYVKRVKDLEAELNALNAR